jgi:hypothetical protein
MDIHLTLTPRQMRVLDIVLQDECRSYQRLDPATRALPIFKEFEEDVGRTLAFLQSHMPEYRLHPVDSKRTV